MADVTPFPTDREGRSTRAGHHGNASTGGDRNDDADRIAEDVLGRLNRALPRPSAWIIGPLAALSIVQIVLVVPWLIDRDPWRLLTTSTAGHVTRDGALGLVVAVAGLLAAWRPRWALPAFLLSSLAVVAQAVTGMFDAAEAVPGGGLSLAGELVHIPSIVITCLIGLAAMPFRSLGPDRG